MKRHVILVDIGSTFTKAVLVDLDRETVLAIAHSPTTVGIDITIGLKRALAGIEATAGDTGDAEILACGSAAGGLRMVSVGLVPELSAEAARRAALGAGARIVGHYAHALTLSEIRRIVEIGPDIILLAGGTDGGNQQTILHNAQMLAATPLAAPIVVAGNKCAGDRIACLLGDAGKRYEIVGNVLPEIGRLDVEPCRQAIRDVFMKNIVHAKGLDRAERLLGKVLMATPDAVLQAATLVAQGHGGDAGLGELVMVDVGGATTDVYSIAKGAPARASVVLRGLPEPFSKRTVEGDLGVRHNIETLAEICRGRQLALAEPVLAAFLDEPARLPTDAVEAAVDEELARVAVETAFARHVGRIEAVYGPHGETFVQTGKDLSKVAIIVGTGGPITCCRNPRRVLSGIAGGDGLGPASARFYLDEGYIVYAMGLLAQREPRIALNIMKQRLKSI